MKIKSLLLQLIIGICLILSTSSSYAQTTGILNGLNWLSNNQNGDGSWDNITSSTSSYYATATILESFQVMKESPQSATNAIAWLQTQSAENAPYLASRIKVALSAGVATSDLNKLLSYKNPDGGWGVNTKFNSSNFHTALALQALKAANYPDLSVSNTALAYLTNTQNPDGGWGFSTGDPSTGSGQADSNIYLTAIVSATLQQFPQTTTIATAITKASAYLTMWQNIDGSFGAAPDGTPSATVFETALAYIAMVGDGQTPTLPLQNALNYLNSTQSLKRNLRGQVYTYDKWIFFDILGKHSGNQRRAPWQDRYA